MRPYRLVDRQTGKKEEAMNHSRASRSMNDRGRFQLAPQPHDPVDLANERVPRLVEERE